MSQTIVDTKRVHPILGSLAVLIALISPALQMALAPFLEANFAYPVDRFLSIWVFWAAAAIAIYVSVQHEGIPLSSFGITRNKRSLRYRLIELNAALILGVVVTIFVLGFSDIARNILNIPMRESYFDPDRVLPFWVILPAWITAAFTEEFLFRAYPIERLTMLTGNCWLSAAISLTAFVLFHLLAWDWVHVLTVVFPAGLLLTLLYLWRRSLWFVVVVHGVVNLPVLFCR